MKSIIKRIDEHFESTIFEGKDTKDAKIDGVALKFGYNKVRETVKYDEVVVDGMWYFHYDADGYGVYGISYGEEGNILGINKGENKRIYKHYIDVVTKFKNSHK